MKNTKSILMPTILASLVSFLIFIVSSGCMEVTNPTPNNKNPDLTVGSISISDSTPTNGQSITLSAIVSNIGAESSSSTTLRWYLSSDSIISSSNDTEIGTNFIPSLPSGGNSNENINISAPSRAGAYYYGACVDSVSDESSTANNCSSGMLVTVILNEPDLTVSSVSISDSTPTNGQSITLSAIVSNIGAESSSSTTLRWYLSSDSIISSSNDTEIGTNFIPSLPSGGNSNENINISAPSRAGAYYYGACVDSVSDESSTANNCSSGMLVTVILNEPDLTVSSVSISDSTPTNGQSITLSAIVSNIGAESSSSTTLRWYLSSDSIISSSNDTEIGTNFIPSLPSGGNSNENINISAPSRAGAYYYGACVDSVSDESSTANNCSSGTSVITDDHGDNQATATMVSNGSSNSGDLEIEGDEDWFAITVSSNVTLRAYTTGSIDTFGQIYSSDRTELINDDDSGTNNNFDVSYNLSNSGTYYIRVKGFSLSTVGSYTLFVKAGSFPDLVVDALNISEITPTNRQSVTLSAIVRNIGTGSSDSTTLRWYFSSNSIIDSSDEVGTNFVDSLSAGSSSSENITVSAPSNLGTYLYVASVDSVSNEFSTANNITSQKFIRVVSSNIDDHGDNQATATMVSNGSSNSGDLESGGDEDWFAITVSGNVTLRAYTTGSVDTVGHIYSSDGTELTNDDDSGTSNNFDVYDVTDSGTYYIRVRGFSLSTVGSYTLVVKAGSFPDLVVDTLSISEITPTNRQSVTLSAIVRNIGTGSSDSTTLRWYFSSNTSIEDPGIEVGTSSVDSLSAGSSSSENITVSAPSDLGLYFFFASVDSVSDESSTINNISRKLIRVVSSNIDDHGDNQATATMVSNGSSSSGDLELGDEDWFAITVSGNGRLRAYTTGGVDTFGHIYSSSGTELASNDDGDGDGSANLNFDVSYDVTDSGTYYIRVRESSIRRAGSYTLFVEFL